jgi:serine protease
MPLRAVGRDGGTASDLADALRYAAGLDATAHGPALPAPLRVVNVSLGTPDASQEIADACAAASGAGTLIVAAAGNESGAVNYPAALPTVLAVGAVDSRLVLASYSNVGSQISLVAPGGNDVRERDGDGFLDGVPSTVLDETVAPRRPGEAYYVGTSMSSPHVAGVAALVLSVDGSLSRAALRTLLESTARDLDAPGVDAQTGHGLVQAGEAVRAALVGLGTPRADAPRLSLSSDSLRFTGTQTIQDVQLANAGGGTLHVGGLVATTDSGFPWLTAFTTAAPAGLPIDASLVAVTVTRVGLAPGVYAGTVTITDGAAALATIRVVMEVGGLRLDGQPFSIVALQSSNGIVRASGIAQPIDGYRFALTGLAPGTYTLHAGTDLDGDGFFCEPGDFCGDSATTVVVTAGGRTTADVAIH